MAVSDQEIADKARASLARILDTDTSEWEEGPRRQRQLEIDRLEQIISRFEEKASKAGGRRIFSGIRRVNY